MRDCGILDSGDDFHYLLVTDLAHRVLVTGPVDDLD